MAQKHLRLFAATEYFLKLTEDSWWQEFLDSVRSFWFGLETPAIKLPNQTKVSLELTQHGVQMECQVYGT